MKKQSNAFFSNKLYENVFLNTKISNKVYIIINAIVEKIKNKIRLFIILII